MQLKDAIKDTNKSLSKLMRKDVIEVSEAIILYKKSILSFIYGTRKVFFVVGVVIAMTFLPILYILAVLIRVFKK